MLSLSVFGNFPPRKPMTSSPPYSDARTEAVTFLGLLRQNEDRLVERTKMLVRGNRAFIQEVFTAVIDEWTPLHACTLRGARKLVKVALKAGVDPNIEMGNPQGLPGRCTPLHLAAYRGDVSILQLLVQNGARVDARDNTNHTPLHYAATRSNSLAARKLLKYGADTSELSPEHLEFYKDDVPKGNKVSALLCIPSRSNSQKRNGSSRYKLGAS
ncbi:ankyrin repeat and protein kinase domain-containing protein 1 [Aplysia californica]|uniref:Ankyrin repeat and protein kinase domain-containing protein 1 n=1 Tax=Aplysia californica TaxID=6500 RepID=A0ABM1A3D3_APLCA|nr:ankyrin repeat and protein kinase domain-containing protein 1 [Aplysia californica]